MGLAFYYSNGNDPRIIAKLSDSNIWSGDSRLVERLKSELAFKGVDWESAKGKRWLLDHYQGGLFWVKESDQ